MKVIPAIDIIDGKCVRLTQGDYAQKTIYSESPVEVAKQFEDAGLKYLHVVDLDGAKAGSIQNIKMIEQLLLQTSLKIDVGGGIKTEESIDLLFQFGVQQVNLGSIAIKNPEMIIEWLGKFGIDKIILSADVRDEKIATHGWQQQSNLSIYDFIQLFNNDRMFVTCTDIATDGMLTGPNITLYKSIKEKFPSLRLIASGGVSCLNDLNELQALNVEGVIIGKAIYENKISLKELSTYVD